MANEAEKYDVTGVSGDATFGEDLLTYTPLVANVADKGRALQYAADYSDGRGWPAVVVKIARTGRTIATYRNGTRTPA